jgi:hypothetical protein
MCRENTITTENFMKFRETVERPVCLNYGCDKLVTSGGKRWRPFCSHCHKAGYKKTPLREGVTPFKNNICNNQDGHLGFACPIDYSRVTWVVGTQIDHMDGNYYNNVPENCDEVCDLCHKEKGRRCGDFKNQSKYLN